MPQDGCLPRAVERRDGRHSKRDICKRASSPELSGPTQAFLETDPFPAFIGKTTVRAHEQVHVSSQN